MRHLLLTLGSCVLAAGCGGGGGTGPTSPSTTTATNTAPAPAVTATTWVGTVTAVRRTQSGLLDTTQTFTGTVTFERGNIASTYEPPDLIQPLIPVDAVNYVLTPGLLRLTHVGTVGPCSYGTGGWDVLMKNSDGFLAVRPNGGVVGRITFPDTSFPVTVTCPTGSAAGETAVAMDLAIGGTASGSRVSGTMAPERSAASTFSGSWDLTGR